MYFRMLRVGLFFPIRVGPQVVPAFPENLQSARLEVCRRPTEPTLCIRVPSGFTKTPSTGRSPTCLFRGGDGLVVGSSGSRQRELTGGSEDEHRTGLPIPETRRSWGAEGESKRVAAGHMKEKAESDTWREERKRGREREFSGTERQHWAELRLGPARKPEPWLSAHVDSKSRSPLLWDNV